MGDQIIRQPDGRFAVFSTVTDTIIVYDATREELVDWWVERETRHATEQANRLLYAVEADTPRKVYFQFTKSWPEALEVDRENGGEAGRAYPDG